MIRPEPLSGEEALRRLREGNQRFAAGTLENANRSPARRIEIAEHQHPFAVIFTCSDSRLAPEIIFDQGLGDLYVVRVPGHFVDPPILGALEYAVQALEIRLIFVLGHQHCGIIKAAIEGQEYANHIAEVIQLLQPTVAYARRRPVDIQESAVQANVELTVARLRRSEPVISKLVGEGQLLVTGGVYQLGSGSMRTI